MTIFFLKKDFLELESRAKHQSSIDWIRYVTSLFAFLFSMFSVPFRLAFVEFLNPFFVFGDIVLLFLYLEGLYYSLRRLLQVRWKLILDFVLGIPWVYGLMLIFPLHQVRFITLLHILRIYELYQVLTQIERKFLSIHPIVFRLVNLMLISFIVAHWVGCFWFIFGQFEGYGVNSWVPPIYLLQESLIRQYLHSLYWGFVNISAVNDTQPQTLMEVLVSLALVFIGLTISATVIGNVGSLLSNIDSIQVV